MDQKAILKALSEIPETLEAFESKHEISPETQEQYMDYHDQVNREEYPEDMVISENSKLFQEDIDVAEKRKILFLLAHIGKLESYNALKKYLKKPDEELLQWAILCFQECKMFLQSYLMESPQGMIGVGAGGKGGKLRCYFVVPKKKKGAFTEKQRKITNEEFEKIAQKLKCEIEEIEFGAYWILLKTLMPINIAPAQLVERGINACNEKDDFLMFHYYVDNVKRPNQERVEWYLQQTNS